jgi:hypothetical protein
MWFVPEIVQCCGGMGARLHAFMGRFRTSLGSLYTTWITPLIKTFKYFITNDLLNTWDQYIENEFLNPSNPLACALMHDDLGALKAIKSSQVTFDMNQVIYGSVLPIMWDASLIEYAAHFGSINCFKFLLVNGGVLDPQPAPVVLGFQDHVLFWLPASLVSFMAGVDITTPPVVWTQANTNDWNNNISVAIGRKPIQRYAVAGCNTELISLLHSAHGLSFRDVRVQAVELGHCDLVRWIMRSIEAPASVLRECRATVFLTACQLDNVRVCADLIGDGFKIRYLDPVILMMAAKFRSYGVLMFLLLRGRPRTRRALATVNTLWATWDLPPELLQAILASL